MLPEFTREEIAAALDGVADDLLAEAGTTGPPVDALQLARSLGLTVLWDDRQQGRARYVRLPGRDRRQPRATILLRPDPRRERQHWAVAHEVGEHAACRALARLGAAPNETQTAIREAVANELASRLLLPSGWFVDDGQACGWDLLRLKSRYATASHELIARRMLQCRPAVIISIFDQGRLYFRRSNLPGRVPPPSVPERDCWQAVRQRGRQAEFRGAAESIQGWPVHEPDWKREILRTEVAEDIEYTAAF